MSLLVYSATYVTALRPTGRLEDLVLAVALFLWPTSPIIMAVQPSSSAIARAGILVIAVGSNSLLYGLVAVSLGMVLRCLGLIDRR